jgi:hypothetical protein
MNGTGILNRGSSSSPSSSSLLVLNRDLLLDIDIEEMIDTL